MPLPNWWQAALVNDWQHGGFGLYIHWPFCEAKCPYCDFNSYVSASVDYELWERALLSELDRHAKLLPGRLLNSIFFGGGTPSLMRPETVEKLIQHATSHWTPANNIEITLEANPSSVEADKFTAFKSAGVNRVSIGVQSLDSEDLKLLGRIHTVDESFRAIEIADQVFDRFSFDLIYARQNQTLADWQDELGAALKMEKGHLSLYQLTIEPGTAFGARADVGKLRGLPDEDLAADMYEYTNDACKAAGLNAYEVSNYCAPDMQSLHNLIYWKGGDYIGIGPGAHGRLTIDEQRWATETALSPTAWLERVEKLGSGNSKAEILTTTDHANELLLMGLRITEGVSVSRINALLARPIEIPDHLVQHRLIEVTGDTVRATDQGRPLLNQIIQELMI